MCPNECVYFLPCSKKEFKEVLGEIHPNPVLEMIGMHSLPLAPSNSLWILEECSHQVLDPLLHVGRHFNPLAKKKLTQIQERRQTSCHYIVMFERIIYSCQNSLNVIVQRHKDIQEGPFLGPIFFSCPFPTESKFMLNWRVSCCFTA